MTKKLILILFSLYLLLSAGCQLFPKKEEPAKLEEIEEDIIRKWEWEISPDSKETMNEEPEPVQSEFVYPLEKMDTESISTKVPQGKKTEIIFNFQNADIKEVLKVILGDIMGLNYTMDKRVTGVITLRTEGEFYNNELLDIVQATLNINGFAIVKSENIFKILPIQEARTESIIVPLDTSVKAGGEVITQIVPLKHVAPQVIIPTLRGLLTKAGFVIAPNDTHAIIISDKVTNMGKLLTIIRTFDVPFFAGKALKFYDIKYADPDSLAKDLEKIVQTLGASTKAPKLDMAFIPFEDINKMLVASSVPEMMESVDAWISNIDVHIYENVPKMYIYKMQHEQAESTVPILTELFKEKITPTDKGAKAVEEPMKIIADKNTNAIIVKALPADYQVIKSIIETLDATPKQVLIEAIIAEVTLGDAMANGVEYFFRKRGRASEGGSISLLPAGITAGSAPLSGSGSKFFSFNRDLDVFISSIAGETELEILSSPHILVRDEQTASIQVGASEPIRSGSTTGSGGVTTAQIQYRDTGTILTVTPRIGENGMITLDIKQEVSDAVPTEDSDIDSPTFTTRVTETSLVVKSGHVIYLGGIINIKNELVVKKVPLLGDIPFLGNAFKSRQSTKTKTELMVLITPHITSTASEADTMTREFKGKLKNVAKMRKKVQ
jgi:general secretion pathway protein D